MVFFLKFAIKQYNAVYSFGRKVVVIKSAEGLSKGREESYIKAKALLFPHWFTSGISVNAALSYRENCASGLGVSVLRLQRLYHIKDWGHFDSYPIPCPGHFKFCIKSQTRKGLSQPKLLSFGMLSSKRLGYLKFDLKFFNTIYIKCVLSLIMF